MSVPGYQQRYVLIQFGHNDQPGKPGHSTDLTTEFPDNIARYVDEARALGAVPVIVTPLTRRAFVNGKLDNSLEPWAEAERQVARQHNALLVDLNAESVAAIQQMGALASTRLAQSPPSKAARSAAVAGNVIQAQLKEVASPVDTFIGRSAPGAAAPGPKRVFDVTHLGDEGADYFSAMIAKSLAAAAPELAAMLLP
jgi:lysophospholipase L1-like esterase